MATGMVSLLNLIVIAESTPVVSIVQAVKSQPSGSKRMGMSVREGDEVFTLDGKRIHAGVPSIGERSIPPP